MMRPSKTGNAEYVIKSWWASRNRQKEPGKMLARILVIMHDLRIRTRMMILSAFICCRTQRLEDSIDEPVSLYMR